MTTFSNIARPSGSWSSVPDSTKPWTLFRPQRNNLTSASAQASAPSPDPASASGQAISSSPATDSDSGPDSAPATASHLTPAPSHPSTPAADPASALTPAPTNPSDPRARRPSRLDSRRRRPPTRRRPLPAASPPTNRRASSRSASNRRERPRLPYARIHEREVECPFPIPNGSSDSALGAPLPPSKPLLPRPSKGSQRWTSSMRTSVASDSRSSSTSEG